MNSGKHFDLKLLISTKMLRQQPKNRGHHAQVAQLWISVYSGCLSRFFGTISPLPLVFEKKQLMPYDVIPAVNQIINNFKEMVQKEVDDIIDSNLRKFRIVDEDKLVTFAST